MAEQHEQGTLVYPRTRWADEARDFTPWLAENENLKLLGEELGLCLEWVDTEKPVGPYFLDILARETGTGVLVAIENQLECTNTHHLGQLLTYATGCDTDTEGDTGIAIWVAPEFCYEHAQALDRLNGWTSGKVRFYGVKIETVRQTPDPEPKPRFRKVVWPGGSDPEHILPRDYRPSQKYEEFFRPLETELERTGFADKAPFKRWGHTGRFFPSRVNPGISYAVSLEGANDAWVTLHIETGDKALTKQVFDALAADREQIDSDIGADPGLEWRWNRAGGYGFSSINVRSDGSIHDPPDKLKETKAWMLDHLPRFKEVFDPQIEKILQELRPTTPTDD